MEGSLLRKIVRATIDERAGGHGAGGLSSKRMTFSDDEMTQQAKGWEWLENPKCVGNLAVYRKLLLVGKSCLFFSFVLSGTERWHFPRRK